MVLGVAVRPRSASSKKPSSRGAAFLVNKTYLAPFRPSVDPVAIFVWNPRAFPSPQPVWLMPHSGGAVTRC